MKPRSPPLQSTRLLDQVRERIRCLHYSLSTEKVYLYWVKFFVRGHGRSGPIRHPQDMGAPGIIDTAMTQGSFSADDIDRMVPMKRAGRAYEVADLVDFLASERAAYISGQIISINGGMI